jgi:hypothetical protein
MKMKGLIPFLLKFLTGIFVVILLAIIGVTMVYVMQPGYKVHAPENAKVKVVENGDGYQLYKNGEPFYIKGAAGDGSLDMLKKMGGNSIRLYRYYNIDSLVKVADTLGLSVMVDLDIPPARLGFDYQDAHKVDSLIASLEETVIRLKDHPSILIWNIGNELNLLDGENLDIWRVVNRIAQMIHRVDPDHPTSTAIPMIWEDMIVVRWFCPDLDILAINSFKYTLTPASTRYTQYFGWNGPYLFGEMGPQGTWQAAINQWHVPIEWNDSRKAMHLAYIYENMIQPDVKCLGAYAFLWGQKQERTHTWYSIFTEDGEKTPVADELSRLWTGEYQANRAPIVEALALDGNIIGDSLFLDAERIYDAQAYISDPEGDSTTLHWFIFAEGDYRFSVGGDREWRPEYYPDLIYDKTDSTATIKAPEYPGGYRLFVYAADGNNNVSSYNLPFFVVLDSN